MSEWGEPKQDRLNLLRSLMSEWGEPKQDRLNLLRSLMSEWGEPVLLITTINL